MSRLIILEGARCTGKSETAQWLRQKGINYATLINFTGFPDRGEKGRMKINNYYHSWMKFFECFEVDDLTFIADRFFFSEVVFSRLYKDYDFSKHYRMLSKQLVTYVDHIDIFFLTATREAFLERVGRDKLDFAGVGDDVDQLLRQQEEYERVFDEFILKYDDKYSGIYYHEIDTSRLNQKQVIEEVDRRIIEGGKV